MMAYGPHRDEQPPRATGVERRMLEPNRKLVVVFYGLDHDSQEFARVAAQLDPEKAARCYAAIVRSLG